MRSKLIQKLKQVRKQKRLQKAQDERLNIYKKQFKEFKKQAQSATQRFDLNEKDAKPYLEDNTKKTGFDRHYIYHTAWAARVLQQTNPEFHVDISSTLYFCAIVSAFVPVKFYDYRPAELELSNLESLEADLTNLHFEDDSINSLSCMHTVEHVGLGRYSDPIDYDGDIKAMNELSRVLAKNGNLFFVTPVGKEAKIIFNGHRIYTKDLVVQLFSDLSLVEFTLIPQSAKDGGLVRNPSEALLATQNYGCGCFWFTKK